MSILAYVALSVAAPREYQRAQSSPRGKGMTVVCQQNQIFGDQRSATS